MSGFPDYPYLAERTAEGRLSELRRHAEDVHAHLSAIWKLKRARSGDAFDLGAAIQTELRESRRLLDQITGLGAHPSADALWRDLGLWPDADTRPLDGDAAEALESLPPEMRAELESGRQSVKQGRPHWRLLWGEPAASPEWDTETLLVEVPKWLRERWEPPEGRVIATEEAVCHLVDHEKLTRDEVIVVLKEAGKSVDRASLSRYIRDGRKRLGTDNKCRLCPPLRETSPSSR